MVVAWIISIVNCGCIVGSCIVHWAIDRVNITPRLGCSYGNQRQGQNSLHFVFDFWNMFR